MRLFLVYMQMMRITGCTLGEENGELIIVRLVWQDPLAGTT